MTAEQHKFLYNFGMNMNHGNSLDLHLCPYIRDYEYFTYWSIMSEVSGIKYGTAVGQNKIQINRRTGEENVVLEEVVFPCPRVTQRVEMVFTESDKKPDCDRIMNELDLVLVDSIWRVAVEKTLVLKVNYDRWEMPMIDFVDAFDPRALSSHFRSLFQCLLAEVNSSGNRVCIINRMTKLFQHLEIIYNAKDELLNQIKSYMQMARIEVEKVYTLRTDLRLSQGKIINEIDRKRSASDCMSFLFEQEAKREHFRKCITVLKAFLEAYLKSDAKNLLVYLQKYALFGVQINSIDYMLRQVDLGSSAAKPANIKLIERYLSNSIHYSEESMFAKTA